LPDFRHAIIAAIDTPIIAFLVFFRLFHFSALIRFRPLSPASFFFHQRQAHISPPLAALSRFHFAADIDFISSRYAPYFRFDAGFR
jgi:hypothetical protein